MTSETARFHRAKPWHPVVILDSPRAAEGGRPEAGLLQPSTRAARILVPITNIMAGVKVFRHNDLQLASLLCSAKPRQSTLFSVDNSPLQVDLDREPAGLRWLGCRGIARRRHHDHRADGCGAGARVLQQAREFSA